MMRKKVLEQRKDLVAVVDWLACSCLLGSFAVSSQLRVRDVYTISQDFSLQRVSGRRKLSLLLQLET